MKTSLFATAFLLVLGSTAAHAIILFGADNNANLTNPGTGVPWESVGRLSNSSGTTLGGSGIYLGNGYILTADHVNPFASITFDGSTFYTHDGVAPQQVGNTDMKILRLSTTPTVAAVKLYTGTSELGDSGTLVGWGVGRDPATAVNATVVPWGNVSTSAKRWGVNTPQGTYDDFRYSIYAFDALQTTLGSDGGTPPGLGASEASATILDSGSGLFQFHDGEWQLTGLTATLTRRSGNNTSTFGNDVAGVLSPAVPPTDPTQIGLFPGAGDINIFVRISSYSDDILAVIPEPSSLSLALLSSFFLLRRKR